MYKLVFYVMKGKDITNPNDKGISFSVAIEDKKRYGKKGSILEIEADCPYIVQIVKPPIKNGEKMYLEAQSLEDAHYICMSLGYTISGKGERMRTSVFAEFLGLHKCGQLEEEYEAALGAKSA